MNQYSDAASAQDTVENVGNVPSFKGVFNEDVALKSLGRYLDFINTKDGQDRSKQHEYLNRLLRDVGFARPMGGDNWRDYVRAYNFLATAANHHDTDKVNINVPSHPKAQVLWVDLPYEGRKYAQLHFGELTKEHYRIPPHWDIPSQNLFLHGNEAYTKQDDQTHKYYAKRKLNMVREHNPMTTEERIAMFTENRESKGLFNTLWHNIRLGGLKLWKEIEHIQL